MNDINKICIMTRGKENDHRKEELYQLTFDENDRVSFNALWALTHFDEANNPWLFQKHDDLIDRVLVEKNETKRRLMLNLLRQPFEEESLRSDFIDFCIAKITACSQRVSSLRRCSAQTSFSHSPQGVRSSTTFLFKAR